MKGALLAVLLAASVAIAAGIGFTLQSPLPDAGAAGPSAARALPAAPGPRPAEDASRQVAMVETLLGRPLFSAGRRPKQAAQVAAAPAQAAVLPRMTAILVDGTARTVIFADANGKPAVVSEGGRIGPFTVQSIEPQQVTIIGPEGKRVVRTSFDPHPPVAAAAVAPLAPIFGATPFGAPILGGPAPGAPNLGVPR